MSSRVAVVIVSWNSAEDLERCLASLAQDQGATLQVIVVDNASADGSADVAQRFPGVELVRNATNHGFARACNQGARHADAPWILLLNPDTDVPPGTIGRWIQAVERIPGVGVSGPRLLNADGTLQPSVRSLPSGAALATLLLKLHRISPSLLDAYMQRGFDYGQPAEVQQVMGAALLTPAEVYRRLGGLSERYPIWFEDVDYCAAVAASGLKVWYEPSVSITHLGGSSFGRRSSLWQQWQFARSAALYAARHLGWRGTAVYLAAPISLVLAAATSLVPRRLLQAARRRWYRA